MATTRTTDRTSAARMGITVSNLTRRFGADDYGTTSAGLAPALACVAGGNRGGRAPVSARLLDLLAYFTDNAVQMTSAPNLGEFEQLVLLAILRLRDDAYGVTIRAELVDRTGRNVAPGAVYTALERLETKGLITSRMSDPTPQRGGRAKRHVTITATGMEALTRSIRASERLLDGLNLVRGTHA